MPNSRPWSANSGSATPKGSSAKEATQSANCASTPGVPDYLSHVAARNVEHAKRRLMRSAQP